MNPREEAKWAAARHALQYVGPGQVVGLGTGSTAIKFLELLAERVREGLEVRGVPTSEAIARQAREWGIPLLDDFSQVDVTVDGADQVDPEGNLIKGGGGAHLREKLVALASTLEIIVVDWEKRVDVLSRPLPVELIEFGAKTTLERLRLAGLDPVLRETRSDGGNLLADCAYPAEWGRTPAELHALVKGISGVVETGIFMGLTHRLVIGFADGRVEELTFS